MEVKIHKGLDLKIAGEAADRMLETVIPNIFYICPDDFRWMQPKLLVNEGDSVAVGTPLFADKNDTRIVVVSPVVGTVKEIVRGEKRVIQAITITRNAEAPTSATVDFEMPADAEATRKLLLQYGLWPCLRQRPYAVIPNPDVTPKAVFVPCFDSNPLAPNFNVLLRGREDHFWNGLRILKRASENAPMHLCMRQGADNQLFEKSEDVEKHYFSGPHPSGNVGTHIHFIDTLDKGEVVWYVDPQEVARIGRFFSEHILQFDKRVALTGPAVGETGYFDTLYGADISELFTHIPAQNKTRIISGSVLSGSKIDGFPTLRFHDRQVTVIAEGGKREILGWLLPGLRKWSMSHTFLSWLTPKRTYNVNTSLQGGRRAFMMTDVYDKVFPFDLIPLEIMKACEIKDVEKMESLGIYEVDSEDFALCELVCPSKKECQKIVEEGMRKLRMES